MNFLFDNRKNSVNALNGSFASVQFRPNMTFLGSDKNWESLTIDMRQYIQFPSGTRNVLAFWNYDALTLDGGRHTSIYLVQGGMTITTWEEVMSREDIPVRIYCMQNRNIVWF